MERKLSVMSYNFYSRPRFLFKDNQVKRARRLAKVLGDFQEKTLKYIDVIMFQEVVDNKTYRILNETLKKLGFIFTTKRIKESMKFNSGTYIISKHPIFEEDDLKFGDSNIFLSSVTKGINYCKILKDNQLFNLINVHYDSFDEDIRRDQMVKTKEFLQYKELPKDEPIIIGGDFNIDVYKEEFENVSEVFDTYDLTKFIPNKFSRHSSDANNSWIDRRDTNNDEESEFLDYFVEKNLKGSSFEMLKLQSKQHANDIIYSTPFYLNFYKPKWAKKIVISDMSDHYAVLGEFRY